LILVIIQIHHQSSQLLRIANLLTIILVVILFSLIQSTHQVQVGASRQFRVTE